jgi:hypothetical protein
MNHRHNLGFLFNSISPSGALRLAALALALPVAACGGYSADPERDNGSGGMGTTTGGAGSGGASTGGASTGGASSGGTGTGAGEGSGGNEQAPEASCESVTACAGDPVGVWFAQSSCLPVSGIADLSGLGIGCASGPISGEIDVTGNFTVNADGTVSDNTSTSGEVYIELEPACLDVSGTVTACDKIGIPLASGGFDTVECVDSETTTGGCTCTGTFSQSGGMGYILAFNAATSGNYTSSDNNTLLVTGTSFATGLETLEYAHCVDGNFAMVTPISPTILGETKGTIVLQKQP